jgi:O-antigen ligase
MLKKYFEIRNKKGDITYLIAILVMVVMPIHYKLLPPLMIMLCLAWIYENYSEFGKIVRSHSKYKLLVIAFLLFYFWQIFSILYTSDLKMGWSNIFGRLSLLIFPIVFFEPGEKIRTSGFTLFRIFAISTTIYVISCFGYALFQSLDFYNGTWSFNPHPAEAEWLNFFYGPDLTYSIHPSYLAMYVLISVFISFESWYDTSLKKGFRIGWLILGSFLLLSIYFISSRAAIIATIIMISFYALVNIINLKKSRVIWVIFFVILIFSLPLFRNNDRVNILLSGFSKEQKFDLKKQDERIIVWKAAMNVIKKNPIMGVGIGDVRTELVKEYDRIGEYKISLQRLNAHNQFLEVLLENGIVGILIFFSLFGYMIFIAINEKRLLYGLFVFMMFVFFMFETVLYRLAGVSFFPLFSFLLLIIPERRFNKT